MTVYDFFNNWRSVSACKKFECITKYSCKNHQALQWNLLTRTTTGKEESCATLGAEDKFIQVSSLRKRKLTAKINATQSSSSKHISTPTVQRRLHNSGLYVEIAGAREHKKWTFKQWKSVLWFDRSKCGSTCCVFVQHSYSERMVFTCIVPTMKHGGGWVMV